MSKKKIVSQKKDVKSNPELNLDDLENIDEATLESCIQDKEQSDYVFALLRDKFSSYEDEKKVIEKNMDNLIKKLAVVIKIVKRFDSNDIDYNTSDYSSDAV